MKELVRMLTELDYHKSPGENTSVILHKAYELMGDPDPFKEAKTESNKGALKLYPELKKTIQNDKEPLFTSFKVAAAGNIIDMGIIRDYDIKQSVRQALDVDFTINDYDDFVRMLDNAKNILIIGDNSGEIVFDRLLAEQLQDMGKDVVYAVKSGPVLNDATMDDAHESGMSDIVRVITCGNNYAGTIYDKCSREFMDTFIQADLIIAKGQANYESLENTELAGDKTFLILKAKCGCVAKNLGVHQGDMIFYQNKIR